QRQLKHTVGYFLRQKFWCAYCGRRFDPKPLEALYTSGSIPKQSKHATTAMPRVSSDDPIVARQTKPDSPIRVLVMREENGRKIEEWATIGGTETGGCRADISLEDDEITRTKLPGQRRRKHR